MSRDATVVASTGGVLWLWQANVFWPLHALIIALKTMTKLQLVVATVFNFLNAFGHAVCLTPYASHLYFPLRWRWQLQLCDEYGLNRWMDEWKSASAMRLFTIRGSYLLLKYSKRRRKNETQTQIWRLCGQQSTGRRRRMKYWADTADRQADRATDGQRVEETITLNYR